MTIKKTLCYKSSQCKKKKCYFFWKVNDSQQVSVRDVQFSENDSTIIVILAGEFVAKRLSALSSTEGKSRRPQFYRWSRSRRRCDRIAHNIIHVLLSTGNNEARPLIRQTPTLWRWLRGKVTAVELNLSCYYATWKYKIQICSTNKSFPYHSQASVKNGTCYILS